MSQALHLLSRKLHTIGLTMARCSNWPAIVRAKLGLGLAPDILRFRDGFVLKPMPPMHATWGEIFEPAIADLYGIARAAPDLIIDVGANVGAFACRAAFLHPRAVVHAFEPSARHLALLEENARLNDLPNIVVHRAVVTRDGREVLFADLGSGGASGIFLHGDTTPERLPSTTLATVPFGASRSLFVKLDCEGAEGEIIGWICQHRDQLPARIAIACEYHHWCPVPLPEILQQLRGHGFHAEDKVLFDESYLFAVRETR